MRNRSIFTLLFSLFISFAAQAQCPSLELYNQGNGGSGNCAGVSGTAINSDFTGTTYATVPSGSKTGNFTARWNPGPPIVTPAISGFYQAGVKLVQSPGPATALTNTGSGYTASYCFYGTGNLPTNTTITVLYVHPQTGALEYSCNYTIPNGNNVSATNISGPSITSQPSSKVGCIGYPTSFAVTASPGSAGTLTYQWQKNDVDISGATSATYTITAVAASDTGTNAYSVIVKESNGTLVSSNKVSLTLNKGATWLGTTSSWATSSNWSPSGIPDSTTHVYIASGVSNMPNVTSGTVKCKCLTLSGGTTTINGGTLEVAGRINIFNSGVLDATNGTVVINGTSVAQNIPASTFSSNLVKDLTINNSTGVSLSGTLGVTGTYTPTAGVFTTGGYLSIKSTSAGTGRIATGSSSGGYISGNVTVERYIPANTYRGWRLLAPGTTGTQTIQSAWQENAANMQSNPNPGYGTIITSTTAYGKTAGFDTTQPSMSILAWSVANQNWSSNPVTNTNVKQLSSENAYFLYTRGDRTVLPSSSSITGTQPTTLRSTGSIRQGDQSAITITASKYVLVGNPFASAIDFSQIASGDRTNVGNKFWIWDPKLEGSYKLGGWVLFDANTIPAWSPSVTTGSYSAASSIIPSGMGFFVQGSHATINGSLILRESIKATASSNNGFKPTGGNTEQMHIMLSAYNDSVSMSTADGTYVLFNDIYADTLDADDASKPTNSGENIGILSNGKAIALDARPAVQTGDTVYINAWKLKQIKYQLAVTPAGFDTVLRKTTARLIDNYLGIDTPVSVTKITRYDFIVNSDTASYSKDRFQLTFTVDTVKIDTTTTVKANIVAHNTISFYPNPSENGKVHVMVTGSEPNTYHVSLMDIQGRIIATDEFYYQSGSMHKELFSGKVFPTGMYNIIIGTNDLKPYSAKILIK